MLDPRHPFWREEPLSESEQDLLAALFEAHAISVRRDSISTHAVIGSAVGSADYFKAMAAPLMTLGSLHGPIVQGIKFLTSPTPHTSVSRILDSGKRVPGWGTSFVKGEPDPVWEGVYAKLYPHQVAADIALVTGALRKAGKMIFPNPAGFTSACAVVLGMPSCVAPYLFLAGRLEVWSALFMHKATTETVWE